MSKKSYLKVAFYILCQVFSDFLIGGLGYFNNTGMPPLAFIGLLLGIIRLNKKARKSKLVFVLYWIGIILTIDLAFILATNASDYFGILYLFLLLIIFIAILFMRKSRKWLFFMTPIQIIAIPIIIIGVSLKWGELWNPASKCLSINNQPGVRILTDKRYNHTQVPHTAIPRFFVPRPERGDILVCNHVYVYEENILLKDGINRLDVKTGLLTPWLKKGHVLAINREEDTGIIYAVIQKNYRDPKTPTVEFVKFDPDGKILDHDSFGYKRGSFYGASIIIRPKNVVVNVEPNFFIYDKESGSLSPLKITGLTGSPIYRSAWADPYYFGVFATTYLFSKLLGSHHAVKINLNTNILEASCSEDPTGFIDIARWPNKKLLAASHFLTKGGWLLDFDLNKVKRLNIPPGVRDIEFSNDGKYLLAAGFIGGKLYVIDPVKNKLVAIAEIGNSTRGLMVAKDGTVLIGSSCGVVSVNLDEFMKGHSMKKSAGLQRRLRHDYLLSKVKY